MRRFYYVVLWKGMERAVQVVYQNAAIADF